MGKRLDADIKAMTAGEAKQELARVRRLVRRHRGLKGNARCWHADRELYEKTLPDSKPGGKMTGDPKVLLANCRRYIRRQQCGAGCTNPKKRIDEAVRDAHHLPSGPPFDGTMRGENDVAVGYAGGKNPGKIRIGGGGNC